FVMSLPTPPGTSHRDKENKFQGSRVAWSQQNQFFYFGNTPRVTPLATSREQPTKSILKKSTQSLLTVPEEKQRDITPEPEDPLANLSYLDSPVSKLISIDSSLRDLIEAYSVLTARLRAAVNGTTDADASWPLFQPVRKHQQAVVDAIVRDLGRALVEPHTVDAEMSEVCDELEEKSLLPSPKNSPRKKIGMTAEQVKYARDLCTTSHAVMKFLGAVFTIPAISRVFNDDQLRAMLTGVLAIPLAQELPTPNARKTCALSIWLLQAQRLPAEVLLPAKDRIAYALRRGIEGELGKEGKKGSTCDGLKAIHDLSIYQPVTFVPAFTELLSSILAGLLAPTLLIRTQACHALGGFTMGCIALPPSYVHTRIARTVSEFLTSPPSSPRKSPTKIGQDSAIIRTLRTTLNAVEPTHVAHGPVWSLSILASLIVLLGSALCEDIKLARMISALLALSMRNKKSSVRGLGCLLWRCVAWAYFRPPLVQFDEDEEDERDEFQKEQDEQKVQLGRQSFWKVVKSVVDMGAGVSTVAALLAEGSDDDERLRKAFSLVKTMIKKGGQTCGDGMEIAKIFVSFNVPDCPWTMNKLLPPLLFSSSPGLLTQDYKTLSVAVKPIFAQCPQFDDIRSLTREDVTREWIFDELIEVWRSGLACLEMPEESTTPPEVVSIWEGLLKGNVAVLQDAGDDDGTVQFACRAAVILVDILQDPNLDLSHKAGSALPVVATSPVKDRSPSKSPRKLPNNSSRSNAALKLSITREFWTIMRTTIPNNLLHAGGAKLLTSLMENEDDLVWETDAPDDARKEWAYLCAEVLVVCDIDELKKFWTRRASARAQMTYEPGVQSLVWNCFVEKWQEDADGTWECAVVLLGIPFADSNAWELSNDDFQTWDNFLSYTLNKALDYGIDSTTVLDCVAEAVSRNPSPTFAYSTRVADLLLGHLEIVDARQVPSSVFEFVNDTLLSTYPPEPCSMMRSIWLLRSLTRIVDACPVELSPGMFEILQDGMCTWISDDYCTFDITDYTDEVLPLYQTSLLGVQVLPRTLQTLELLAPLLESSFSGRTDKPATVMDSFDEFWNTCYANMSKPENGWPEKIQTCLRSLAELHGTHSPDQENSPRSPSAMFTFPAPSTPTKRSNCTTPPRPHKPSTTPVNFQSLLLRTPTSSLPLSAGTHTTPRRSPTAKSEQASPSLPVSPGKHRIMENKENVSPLPVPSVLERILANSPSRPKSSSVLGKRRSFDEERECIPKKGRTASGTFMRSPKDLISGSDSEDEKVVEATLSSDPLLSPRELPTLASAPEAIAESAGQLVSGSNKRKRKSVFMDAVEVPTLREVRRRWKERRVSLQRSTDSSSTPTKLLRRTSSLPKMSDTEEEYAEGNSRKRLKRWDEMVVSDSDATIPSSPFKLSSDDDPHLGQVTPHHLISPALRRVHGLDYDPPSDDSTLTSSPSRDIVTRRRQRLLSFSEAQRPQLAK
ncbi:hypothetical protein SERLA73DRAFT_56513, partial [Serpula lacrymans var. lacrymans S7.3]